MTGRRMAVHRSAPEPCPYCAKTLDADTGATPGGGGPRPGDIGICWGCLEPLVFDDDMHRRKPTPAEAIEIAGHPVVQAAIRRARSADR
jgi:hypothetical protein